MTFKIGSCLGAFAVLVSSCTGGGSNVQTPAAVVSAKIAFLEDLSVEGSLTLVTPSYQALLLAIQTAELQTAVLPPNVRVQLVPFDTQGDQAVAADNAAKIVADPAFVAAVIGPFSAEPASVGAALSAAGVATISLSSLGPNRSVTGWKDWYRAVASQRPQVQAVAARLRAASPNGICLVSDGSPFSVAFAGQLGVELGGDVSFRGQLPPGAPGDLVVARIRETGCGAVAWAGFASEGAVLRVRMTQAGLGRIPMVGSEAVRTDSFLTNTGPAGKGTVMACPCIDLTTSSDLSAERFIHDYQSEFANPPGPYAAEGFDVGSLLLHAIAKESTRRGVASALAAAPATDGLAGNYSFDGRGERESAGIHFSTDDLTRWAPIDASSVTSVSPRASDTLTVGTCHSGFPYVYRRAGRLTGFDVQLAAAFARRLGTTLRWNEADCASARGALAAGKMDALFAAPTASDPGIGIVLSIHVAITVNRHDVSNQRNALQSLHAGDSVAVVGGEAARWAKLHLPNGVGLVHLSATPAYDRLAAGVLAAVLDQEPSAWANVEHRPALRVAHSFDAGAYTTVLAADPGLRSMLVRAFSSLLDGGTYGRLFAKYFPGTPIPPEVRPAQPLG